MLKEWIYRPESLYRTLPGSNANVEPGSHPNAPQRHSFAPFHEDRPPVSPPSILPPHTDRDPGLPRWRSLHLSRGRPIQCRWPRASQYVDRNPERLRGSPKPTSPSTTQARPRSPGALTRSCSPASRRHNPVDGYEGFGPGVWPSGCRMAEALPNGDKIALIKYAVAAGRIFTANGRKAARITTPSCPRSQPSPRKDRQ